MCWQFCQSLDYELSNGSLNNIPDNLIHVVIILFSITGFIYDLYGFLGIVETLVARMI